MAGECLFACEGRESGRLFVIEFVVLLLTHTFFLPFLLLLLLLLLLPLLLLSPGFFAPEMITAKCYNGFACDLWSIGCILLELVLGRETFTSMWMCSYALDVLTNQASFQSEMQSRSADVHAKIAESDTMECSDILHGLLAIDPQERWTLKQLRAHSWLSIDDYESSHKIIPHLQSKQSRALISTTVSVPGSNDESDFDEVVTTLSPSMDELSLLQFEQKSQSTTLPNGGSEGKEQKPLKRGVTSPAPLNPLKHGRRPRSAGSSDLIPTAKISALASRRSKKLNVMTNFDDQRGAASPATMKQRAGQLHLPPICSPDTPKIRQVRKILDSGNAIVRQLGMNAELSSSSSSSSPPVMEFTDDISKKTT